MEEKNNMQHTHKVTVGKESFQIRSDQPPSIIENIAKYVDSQIKELSKSQMRGDTSRLAILAAMNIAGELLEVKEQLGTYKHKYNQVEERAKELYRNLEKLSL
jgi:cell division protein ZapA (FtsZ GTPase activity inhibitor)